LKNKITEVSNILELISYFYCNLLKMSGPIFVQTIFTVNGEKKTVNALSKGNSYMLDFNCVGYKSLKSSDVISHDGKEYFLSRNFLNEKKESPPSNKGKISFEEKTFLLNGTKVPISCVSTKKNSYMCDTFSLTFGLLNSAKTIEAEGKTYILQDKFLNATEFKRIEVSALFDRKDGFQGSIRLTIQGKEPSAGGLIINQEIFEEKTFSSDGFVCLIDHRPWKIVVNDKGIWAHPVLYGEVFEAFRALKRPSNDVSASEEDDFDAKLNIDGSGDWA